MEDTAVDLFFSPMACSLACRIASYEAGIHTSTLTPESSLDLDRVHQWLSIVIGSQTRDFVVASLDFLDERLKERQFLLGRFSSADAYLCALLNCAPPTRIDLSAWPAIKTYRDRLAQRPSISRAIAEELALHEAAIARHPSFSELSFRASL